MWKRQEIDEPLDGDLGFVFTVPFYNQERGMIEDFLNLVVDRYPEALGIKIVTPESKAFQEIMQVGHNVSGGGMGNPTAFGGVVFGSPTEVQEVFDDENLRMLYRTVYARGDRP